MCFRGGGVLIEGWLPLAVQESESESEQSEEAM